MLISLVRVLVPPKQELFASQVLSLQQVLVWAPLLSMVLSKGVEAAV